MFTASIIGRLGADATLRTDGGREYLTFRVAHSQSYTKSDGTAVESVDWVSCVYTFENAKNLLPFLKKGTQVYVSGAGSLRVYSSKKVHGFVAGLDVHVRDLQLLAGTSEFPREVYDDLGVVHDVIISGRVRDSQAGSVFKSRRGEYFYVDSLGFLKKDVNPRDNQIDSTNYEENCQNKDVLPFT